MAARERAALFARRLGAEAARRGSLDVVGWRGRAADGGGHEAMLRPVVVLGDGARWIWDEAVASFGGERTDDWWHGAEHLWELSKALHGEGTPEATAWAEHATHLLWGTGRCRCWHSCTRRSRRMPMPSRCCSANAANFTTNACRIQYPWFRKQGLPVASGAIEGSAKHLVQQRMKRAGMRWSELGARAILHLRVTPSALPLSIASPHECHSSVRPVYRSSGQFRSEPIVVAMEINRLRIAAQCARAPLAAGHGSPITPRSGPRYHRQ